MRKNCFGYKKADVDEKIAEMQEMLQMNEAQIAILEDKLIRLQTDMTEKDQDLGIMADELNKYISQSQQTPKLIQPEEPEAVREKHDRYTADIDRIYSQAYNTAITILKSAQQKAEEYLDQVSEQTVSADEQAKAMLAHITQVKTELSALLSDVSLKANGLAGKIGELSEIRTECPAAVKKFDVLRQEIRSSIDDQIQEYYRRLNANASGDAQTDLQTASLGGSVQPAQKSTNSTQTNMTGNVSEYIVDIVDNLFNGGQPSDDK